MDLGLQGKTALAAASTEGLGYATARALAEEGCRVWLGSRDAAKTAAAVERLRQEVPGSTVGGTPLDMSDAASIRGWVVSAAEFYGPGIDALVCNSGGPPPGRFSDFDDDAWRSAFDLLVLSAVRLIRASMPGLSLRGGSILIVSSTSVKEPIESLLLSNSLRSATAAMAKTLAAELAPSLIRINCLAPGRFATGRVERIDRAAAERSGISAAEARSRAEAAIPLGRYGDPEEYGRAACWLLSPAASYVTGQLLSADGGMSKGTW